MVKCCAEFKVMKRKDSRINLIWKRKLAWDSGWYIKKEKSAIVLYLSQFVLGSNASMRGEALSISNCFLWTRCFEAFGVLVWRLCYCDAISAASSRAGQEWIENGAPLERDSLGSCHCLCQIIFLEINLLWCGSSRLLDRAISWGCQAFVFQRLWVMSS